MVDVSKNNFVPSEISKSYIEKFLLNSKVKSSLMTYKYYDIEFKPIGNISEDLFIDNSDLEESLYAYFWLLSKGAIDSVYTEHIKHAIWKWASAKVSSDFDTEEICSKFTAFELYEDARCFPFNFFKFRVYSIPDIQLLLNVFGLDFIPDKIVDLLRKNECIGGDGFHFNESLTEAILEDFNSSFCCFNRYIPSTLTSHSIEVLSECSGLLYATSWMNFGSIIVANYNISNFLSSANASLISKFLECLNGLLPFVDPGMMCASEFRVITKDSPLWEFYKSSYYYDENVEYALIASYFILDVSDVFDMKFFSKEELCEIEVLTNSIIDLLSSKEM